MTGAPAPGGSIAESQYRASSIANKRPAFLHVSLGNWQVNMDVLVEVEKALGSDYIAVRADHLPALYMEAKNRR